MNLTNEELFSSSILKGDFFNDSYTFIKTVKNPQEEILLFIIHGIGQSEKSIKNSLNKIVSCIDKLYNKYSILFKKQIHIRFINWKKYVQIGNISRLIDSNIKSNHPKSYYIGHAPTDLMYYTSKNKKTLLNFIIQHMNEYLKLVSKYRNFIFKGSVSCIGHSLGSVILYDILTQMTFIDSQERNSVIYGSNIDEEYLLKSQTQNQPFCTELIDDLELLSLQILDLSSSTSFNLRTSNIMNSLPTMLRNSAEFEYRLHFSILNKKIISLDKDLECLNFPIDHLFFMGSPLSLFLSVENGNLAFLQPMNTVKDFHNIIHPMDPIAYRIEPLIKDYPYTDTSYLLPNWESEERRDSLWISLFKSIGIITNDTSSVINHDNVINRKRYDFILKESPLERAIHIIGFLFSHMEYWNNVDCFYFILKMCHWQGYNINS